MGPGVGGQGGISVQAGQVRVRPRKWVDEDGTWGWVDRGEAQGRGRSRWGSGHGQIMVRAGVNAPQAFGAALDVVFLLRVLGVQDCSVSSCPS